MKGGLPVVPMEAAIDTTGLRLYLEVGGNTGPFRVDVMDDLDEGLIMASSEPVSGLLEVVCSSTTLDDVPSVLAALGTMSPGVSVRTEIFSSTEAPPIDVGRRTCPALSGCAFFMASLMGGTGSMVSSGLCDLDSEATLSGASELLE